MDKEFYKPRKGYVTKDYELPDTMQAEIDSGRDLYILGPVDKEDAVVSTDKRGFLNGSLVTHVPMNKIRIEVVPKPKAISYMPDTLKEHVNAGGKLYMVGLPEDRYETVTVSKDKESWMGIRTNINVRDLEYAEDYAFTAAIDDLSEIDNGLDRNR